MRMTRFFVAVLCIVLVTSGCMVLSVYPYYTDDQVRFDRSLVGRWDAGKGEYWVFSETKENKYLVTITDDGDVIGIMEGTLFDAGGYTFMDLYPWDFEYKQVVQALEVLGDAFGDSVSSSIAYSPDLETSTEMDLWWNSMHLVPVHSVLRVNRKDADTIHLAMLNVEWLADQLKDDPGLIKYELPGQDSGNIMGEDDPIMLTASTGDLQRFIVKYAENEDAFDGDELTRVDQ